MEIYLHTLGLRDTLYMYRYIMIKTRSICLVHFVYQGLHFLDPFDQLSNDFFFTQINSDNDSGDVQHDIIGFIGNKKILDSHSEVLL